jgi:hypothetical protein
MDGGQLRRGEPGGGVALVELDLVGNAELLQLHEVPLRTGVVVVIDDIHGGFLRRTAVLKAP